jgi:hypothetical protein
MALDVASRSPVPGRGFLVAGDAFTLYKESAGSAKTN